MKELGAALDDVGADRDVRVVVLRGRGPGVLERHRSHAARRGVAVRRARRRSCTCIISSRTCFIGSARLHQPVIAALHGVCIGMALELALAADIRIASEDCVARAARDRVRARARRRRHDAPRSRRRRAARARADPDRPARQGAHRRALRARPRGRECRRRSTARVSALRRTARGAIRRRRSGSRRRCVRRRPIPTRRRAFGSRASCSRRCSAQPDLMTRFPAALAFIKAQIAAAE